jgi:hypothetical protein
MPCRQAETPMRTSDALGDGGPGTPGAARVTVMRWSVTRLRAAIQPGLPIGWTGVGAGATGNSIRATGPPARPRPDRRFARDRAGAALARPRAPRDALRRRMKLLTFLARRFAWTPAVASPVAGAEAATAGSMEECVVVFVHAERRDADPRAHASSVRQAVKHVQWLARKRGLARCVLHSFTHLGGDTAEPAAARAWLSDVGVRLRERGFEVAETPFGHSCAWDLAVHGEPLAKVWKELGPGATVVQDDAAE